MKVTTVRFGADLWEVLKDEAALAGISVSQYLREAALARAVAAATLRGEGPFESLAGDSREVRQRDVSRSHRDKSKRTSAKLTRATASEAVAAARAVRAQSEQAVRHAAELGERSDSVASRDAALPAEIRPA
jgi:ADP-ribosylglycohydrolase